FFSSRRRHTRCLSDWSSDVCSSDLITTLDMTKQTLAEQNVRDHVNDLHNKNVWNAALVSIDPRNGEVLAYVGSVDYYNRDDPRRSEEHTSELQSLRHLVCRLLLEKK